MVLLYILMYTNKNEFPILKVRPGHVTNFTNCDLKVDFKIKIKIKFSFGISIWHSMFLDGLGHCLSTTVQKQAITNRNRLIIQINININFK